MARADGLVVVVLVAAIGAAGAGVAAEPAPVPARNTDARDARAIAVAEARWKTRGRAALPEVGRAMCDPRSEALREAARDHMRAVGLAAVPVMIAANKSAPQSAFCDAEQDIPDILCSSPPGTDDDLDRAVAALVNGTGAGDPGRGLDHLQQALVRPTYLNHPCPNGERIARALATRVLTAHDFAARPAAQRDRLIALASAMGPEAAPYVPTLASWLDGSSRGIAAARALRRVGSKSASAAPALIRIVERAQSEAMGQRQVFDRYGFPREDALVAGIEALGTIGPDAKAAAVLLPPLLHAEIEHFDSGHHGNVVVAILEALPRLGPPIPASVVADVAGLLGRRRTRPRPVAANARFDRHAVGRGGIDDSRSSMIGIIGGPDVTWARIVAAAGQLGPAGASLAPLLTPLMLGPEVDLRLRAAAADALGRIGARLPADAEATRRLLVGRGDWYDGLERRINDNKDGSSDERSSRFARAAVDRCRADTGLPAVANADDLARRPEGDNFALGHCLASRLCGPRPQDREGALRTCCDYAYPGTQPALCGGAARAAAPAPAAKPPIAASPAQPAPPEHKGTIRTGSLNIVATPVPAPPAPVTIANPGLAFRAVWGEYDLRHMEGIVAAGFRRDGSYVSVTRSGAVRVWDIAKRKLIAEWSKLGAVDSSSIAALSPDGQLVAIWQPTPRKLIVIRVGDARNPSAVVREIGDALRIRALAFAGADALFCVGAFSRSGTEVRAYDIRTGAVRAGIPVDDAQTVAVSPDGAVVVVAGVDWVKAWRSSLDDFPLWQQELAKASSMNRCRHEDDHHGLCLPALTFTSDGNLLLGSRWAPSLVDVRSGRTLAAPTSLGSDVGAAVEDLAVSPDGRHAISITGKEAPLLRFWDLASGRETDPRIGTYRHPYLSIRNLTGIRGVAFTPDGAGFVAHGDWDIVPWDAGRRLVVPRAGHEGRIGSMRVSPDGARLLTGGGDDSVRSWDVATGREVARWTGLGGHVELTPDGGRMLIASVNSAAVIDLASGRKLWSVGDRSYGAYARLSPDGKTVASLGQKEGACVHRTADGTKVWCVGEVTYESHPLAFSPAGDVVVAPGGSRQKNKAFLWDAASGKPVAPFGPPVKSLPYVIGSSGSWALLADPLRETVPLPAAAAGKEFLAPLAVSADKKVMAAADLEGRVMHLVTLADGGPINHVDLSPLGDAARAAAFSPDGKRLYVGTERGVILVFDIGR